jgi:hypothetical protein
MGYARGSDLLQKQDVFLLYSIQTAPGAQPSSHPLGSRCSSRVSSGRGVMLTKHFHLVLGQKWSCNFWGFHGSDYEECRLPGYKNPVCTSQETHYISATESSQLMLCKVWGFHGCDYEECRLLGYKTPVCTSQETHYISTTETSRLMLCKVWGVHGCDYEECRLLGYKTQFVLHRRHITSPLQSPAVIAM